MRPQARAFLLLLLPLFVHAAACLLQPRPACAEDTVITADTIEQEGSGYRAIGSVRIQKAGMVVEADELTYDAVTSEASLQGNVTFDSPQASMKAKRANLNIETETGLLYDVEVFIKKDNYHFRSREVEKAQGQRYSLRDASITTCDAPVPAWCLKGREIDVVLGDRLTGRGVSFRVKGVPVMYTPYLWAPILTDRKTGLLMPTFGYADSKGFYWKQPFFWAMSDNRDATFFLDVYARRGLGEGVEYRYIEGKGVEGTQYVYHLRDTALNTDFYDIRGGHSIRGSNAGVRLNLNIVNRREFLRLHKPYIEERSKRFLESSFEAENFLKQGRLYLRGNHWIELKEGVRQGTVAQRMPEAGFVLNPQGAGSFSFAFGSSIANFSRKEGAQGRRLVMDASAGHTIGSSVTLFQSVSIEEALYDLDGTDERGIGRTTGRYDAALQGRFIKGYRSFSHALVPAVSYRYIVQNGEEPPLFDSAELRPPQGTVELSLTNRLRDRDGEFAVARLSEVIDSEDGNNLKLSLALRRLLTLRLNSSYDLREGAFKDSSAEASASVSKASVSLGQQYSRDSDVFVHTFGIGYDYSKALFLGAKLWYDSKEGQLSNLTGDIKYTRQCWGLSASLARRPHDYSVFLTIDLKGLGAFGVL
ncbi:MAG: LPS assembly protein LptD [Thermodesulfovibrionales bacterium]|nr:LPS assembly protein LptD [Thermodesulfovibrionales bacterium]